LVLNFFDCTGVDQNFIPEGTYPVAASSGCVYPDTYSWFTHNGTQNKFKGGYVTVKEVDGQYHFSFDGIIFGHNNNKLYGSFTGSIEGMVVPSAWTEPTPGEITELNVNNWERTYGTWGDPNSNEFEITWYDELGTSIVVDWFGSSTIEPGVYNL
jgi:hypothetical protein